jgi:hypothetical protein
MTKAINTIAINSTTKALNKLVLASVSYDDALATVRAESEAGRLTKADAILGLAMAYEHHAPGRYAGQRYTAADAAANKSQREGYPLRSSALEAKIRYDLKGIFYAEQTKSAKASDDADIEVPADIAKAAALLAKLCNEYEGSKKLASTAIAQAFTALK